MTTTGADAYNTALVQFNLARCAKQCKDTRQAREELLEMMRLGAVGELTGWAFDEEGHIVNGGTNLRLTSIPPRIPAQALTIGAAVGRAKVSAIRAALKGRLLNGLITDEMTAGAILKL